MIDESVSTLANRFLSGKDTKEQVAGKAFARLQLTMRNWEMQPLKIRDMANQKAAINRWIAELQYIVNTPLQNVMETSGFFGYAMTNHKLGLNVSKDTFLESYNNLLESAKGINKGKALMWQRNLIGSWGKNKYEKYYKMFDEYLEESRRLGLTLTEQYKIFNTQKAGRNFVNLIDSKGRHWNPRHYMNMFSLTRSKEMSSKTTIRTLKDNDQNIVRVSNHGTETPICMQYEGRYFALEQDSSGLPLLDVYPPFHPNCKHVLLPAGDFEFKMKKENEKINKRIPNFTDKEKEQIDKQETFNRVEFQGRRNKKRT
jgi:hypothetical protein